MAEQNKSYKFLKEHCQACQDCELHQTRQNVVWGDGNDETARIIFVGEAPGAKEDERGLPFVGRSGNLLRANIDDVGLPREEIFITNVIQCRPPGNRDPSQDEIQSCSRWLEAKIKVIKPKIVVAVGKFATAWFLDKEPKHVPITKIAGSRLKRKDYILIPIFHPSYVLRNQSKREEYLEQMRIVLGCFEGSS